MIELNDSIMRVLKTGLWYIGTCGDEPNIVPVGFKEVTPEGKLIVGVLHLDNTIANIEKNNCITVTACSGNVKSGFSIKNHAKFMADSAYFVYGYNITGTARFVKEGPHVDKWKSVADKMLKGAIPVTGILEITPENVSKAMPDLINA